MSAATTPSQSVLWFLRVSGGWHQDVVISESVAGEACTYALAKVFKPKGPARNSQPSRLRRPIMPLPSLLPAAVEVKGTTTLLVVF